MPTSTARWTSSRSAGARELPQIWPGSSAILAKVSCDEDPPGSIGARAPHPHAVRGGVRDVAVRRGVAVGGDRELLRAAARHGARARADHAVADPGAVR